MRSGPFRQGLSLEGWKQRFQSALTSRFALRFHMTLLVLGVLGVGVLAGQALRPVVHSMGLRYALTVLLGYGAFFGVVRLWLGYAARTLIAEVPAEALPPEAPALVGRLGEAVAAATPPPPDGLLAGQLAVDLTSPSVHSTRGRDAVDGLTLPSGSGSGGGGGGGGFDLGGDGEGFVVVVVVGAIVAVLLAVFGAAALSVWQAPAILGEAAFEMVLGATLARAARRIEGRNWALALWRATWARTLALLVVATIAGFAVQTVCPGVATLGEAVDRCVRDRPS